MLLSILQDLALTAQPGQGYTSWELSQLYENSLCGQCFPQDAIFWSGAFDYSCAEVRQVLLKQQCICRRLYIL